MTEQIVLIFFENLNFVFVCFLHMQGNMNSINSIAQEKGSTQFWCDWFAVVYLWNIHNVTNI